MPRNHDIDAPTVHAVTLDADLGRRTYRGVDIFAAGDISITDVEDNTITVTIPAAALPFRWAVQIRRVNSTGTTIANTDIIGLR